MAIAQSSNLESLQSPSLALLKESPMSDDCLSILMEQVISIHHQRELSCWNTCWHDTIPIWLIKYPYLGEHDKRMPSTTIY